MPDVTPVVELTTDDASALRSEMAERETADTRRAELDARLATAKSPARRPERSSRVPPASPRRGDPAVTLTA